MASAVIPLPSHARLDWLQQRLRDRGWVAVHDAASELDVSEMTVRRDLQTLDELGWARRVRGGATRITTRLPASTASGSFRASGVIATKVARLIPARGAVALDASVAMLRVIAVMPPAQDLDVITNGVPAFAALQRRPGVRPILTGGARDQRPGSLCGPLAEEAARRVVTGRFFFSAVAVDRQRGPSEVSLEEARIKLAFGEVTAEAVLAVDSALLDHTSPAATLPWDRIALLVTELDPFHPALEPYRSRCEVL